MQTHVLALILSVVAIGVAGYALVQERADPHELEARLTAIEDQVARVEDMLRERGTPAERAPSLMGLGMRSEGGDSGDSASRAGDEPVVDRDDTHGGTPGESFSGGTPEELTALVEAAVAKKAAEMQVMRDKKPSLDTFAKTLELSDAQRQAAAQNVVRAQRAIQGVLEIPAEDGTRFLEELVETMAHGMAHPGQDPGRGRRLYGRLLSEKIPGSDETYAARVESVKTALRESFRRDWTPRQYATFEAWHMDPTEVKGIEGSPWREIEARVRERAKDLGAEIPAQGER